MVSARYLKYLADLIKLRLAWKKTCMRADPELKMEALKKARKPVPIPKC